jgi:hypothetical protein
MGQREQRSSEQHHDQNSVSDQSHGRLTQRRAERALPEHAGQQIGDQDTQDVEPSSLP